VRRFRQRLNQPGGKWETSVKGRAVHGRDRDYDRVAPSSSENNFSPKHN
jgi:hypothetical protein